MPERSFFLFGPRGFLLETWILHELRAAMARLDTGGQISYWRTPSGSEVDFVWTRAGHAVELGEGRLLR